MLAVTLCLWMGAADPATQPMPPEPPPAVEAVPAGAPTALPTTSAAPAPQGLAAPPAREPLRPGAFRLSLNYAGVLGEDGDLTDSHLSTNAIGIDLAFSSAGYVRNHLGLGTEWESKSGYAARGFRLDLISFGYPIVLADSVVRLDLEPIITLVRGEIMFVEGGDTFWRMESGFGLDLSATYRQWFVGVEPDVDFRYWVYGNDHSSTGFGRIFPLRVEIGHEF
jgi:hypothetical protein